VIRVAIQVRQTRVCECLFIYQLKLRLLARDNNNNNNNNKTTTTKAETTTL